MNRENKINQKDMLLLLGEFIACHAPSGDEGEIDIVIKREFGTMPSIHWQDGIGNIIGRMPNDGPKVMIVAHKDEIGMIVTAVHPDGRLAVRNLGGSSPWKYGEGPIDILTDSGEVVRAILSVGSTHTLIGPLAELHDKRALTWDLVTLFTGMQPDELTQKGIHPGSRAVVARERKQIQYIDPMIASYALDDRMGLVSMIEAAKQVIELKLPLDLYFVAATQEEVGLYGAKRAAQVIQPDICIALDTSPVTPDLPLSLDARPVIWYGERAYHNKTDSDTLLRLAHKLGFGAQPVVYDAAASDAGGIKQAGLADRTIAFGFARDNSHGYEIAHPESMVNVAKLLVAYLEQLG